MAPVLGSSSRPSSSRNSESVKPGDSWSGGGSGPGCSVSRPERAFSSSVLSWSSSCVDFGGNGWSRNWRAAEKSSWRWSGNATLAE